MANKFPLILNTSANQIQEIASGDNLDLTGCGINNAGVITATSFSGNGSGLIGVASTDYIVTGTAATFNNTTNFNGNVNISSNIDVDGHTNLDNVSIAGVTTMSGDITISNTSPKISLVDTNNNDDFDLMNADGIFQIVDATNSANRLRIDSTGTVNVSGNLDVGAGVDVTGNVVASGNVSGVDGTFTGNVSIGGTLTYEDVTNIDSVGLITARNGINVSAGTATFQGAIDANSDLDVDGHTNLDNVSIAGVTTFSGDVKFTGTNNVLWDASDNALEFEDAVKIKLGSDDDIVIHHTGGYNYIEGQLRIGKNNSVRITDANDDTRLQVTNTGATVTGTSAATSFSGGTYTSTDWFVNDTAAEGMKNTATGQFFFSQASNETRLYHGSNAQVKLTFRGSGDTYRGAVNADANGMALLTGAASEEYGVLCVADGATNLYWDASKKFETTHHGAIVTGILTATSFKLADGSNVGGVDSDSDENTVGGTGAGENFTSGGGLKNTCFGKDAGNDITSGDFNVAIGHQTLDACNSGRFNTAVGNDALGGLTSGVESTAFGYNAGLGGNGGKNVFMGYAAGQAVTSGENTIVGYEAGKANNTNGKLVAFGMEAAHNSTSSQRLTALGYQAGRAHTGGNGNTYVGYQAGKLNGNGDMNCVMGDQTVRNSSDFNRATVFGAYAAGGFGSNANDNTVIGYNAGSSTLTGTNNIIIGSGANLSGNVSNEITLGDANITKFRIPGIGLELTGPVGLTTEQVTPSSNVATLNLAKDDHKIVASGTYTVNVSGGTEAGSHTLRIENSGTANVGFSTYFKFPSGGTPSLPTASGAISLISFTVHKVGSVGIATVLLAGASVNYS